MFNHDGGRDSLILFNKVKIRPPCSRGIRQFHLMDRFSQVRLHQEDVSVATSGFSPLPEFCAGNLSPWTKALRTTKAIKTRDWPCSEEGGGALYFRYNIHTEL